jgi:hypothetical protein
VELRGNHEPLEVTADGALEFELDEPELDAPDDPELVVTPALDVLAPVVDPELDAVCRAAVLASAGSWPVASWTVRATVMARNMITAATTTRCLIRNTRRCWARSRSLAARRRSAASGATRL